MTTKKLNQLPSGHAQMRRRRRRETVTRISNARTRKCTENSQIARPAQPEVCGVYVAPILVVSCGLGRALQMVQGSPQRFKSQQSIAGAIPKNEVTCWRFFSCRPYVRSQIWLPVQTSIENRRVFCRALVRD